MAEVVFVRAGRVIAEQGQVAVGVGGSQAVMLGQKNSLNDVEALLTTHFQVMFGFGQGQAVEEFPGGIAQPEEWLASFSDEETAVLRESNAGRGTWKIPFVVGQVSDLARANHRFAPCRLQVSNLARANHRFAPCRASL